MKPRIVLSAISSLKPDPDNPRKIGKAELERLGASVKRFGLVDPVIARRKDRVVIHGHQRLEAARRLGYRIAPVIFLDLTKSESRALAIALNNPEAQGTWDEEKLSKILKGLPRRLVGATGFSEATLFELGVALGGNGKELPEDWTPPVPLAPKSEPGGLYELGPHRILCADSTQEGNLEKLLGGKRADCFITDPPYGIYGSSTGLGADVTDDKIIRPFFRSVLLCAKASTEEFAHVYVFCDWRSWASWWEMAKQAELKVKNCLVWDKGDFGMGANYPNAHEFILFAANMARDPTMTSKRRTGQRQVLNQANILRFPRAAGEDRQHNAAKPTALLGLLIENGTDPGQSVIDPFLGSGSTLVAAEKAGRVCYGLEIDPKWCDVTRQRYADFVKQAKYSPTGKLSKEAPA